MNRRLRAVAAAALLAATLTGCGDDGPDPANVDKAAAFFADSSGMKLWCGPTTVKAVNAGLNATSSAAAALDITKAEASAGLVQACASYTG